MSAKILIVEDDADILFAVKNLFEMEGYAVSTAVNGADALKAVSQNGTPDLVLLDMIMPVMNGWEFAKAFRERYGTRTPILVMTAAANARERAQDIQADDWISKPFNFEDALQKIRAFT